MREADCACTVYRCHRAIPPPPRAHASLSARLWAAARSRSHRCRPMSALSAVALAGRGLVPARRVIPPAQRRGSIIPFHGELLPAAARRRGAMVRALRLVIAVLVRLVAR